VKINEVIIEALNKSTGTPNANPAPPPEAPADADQTQWTGRNPADPAKPDYSQKPGAYGSNPGATATYNVPTGVPNPATTATATPAATPAATPGTTPGTPEYNAVQDQIIANADDAKLKMLAAQGKAPGIKEKAAAEISKRQQAQTQQTPAPQTQTAPVDTEYQDQLDKNIQQKQQAAIKSAQANTPAQKAKQGLKNFGGALAKGIKGAVKGFNQSRDMNQARAAGGDNLNLEFDAANKFIQQRGAVSDMRNPQELQKALQAWANSRYPSAGNAVDVSTVQPGNKRSIEDYVTKMYSTAMSNRSMGQTAKNTAAAGTANTQQTSTLIDPKTNKPFVTAPANQPATPAPASAPATTQSTAPGPDAHDDKDIEHDMVPGMEIIQKEPIIVKYKNREFGLNDQGEWVHLGGTKTPHQSFQAMLDKAAGFSESFDPGKMLWDKMKK
jgi:hypothetical protein